MAAGIEPEAGAHIAPLTGLRGLAAAWVALHHLWQALGSPQHWWTAPIAIGYVGVDLFFVLSGFLLAPPLIVAARRAALVPALQRFWVRRCRRVLPAYWVQLAVLVLIAMAVHSPPNALSLATHATLTMNLAPLDVQLLNAVYWSLPVEWNFYIVLPLLAAALVRWSWMPVLLATLFAVALFRYLAYSTVFIVPPENWLSWWAGSIHQLPARLDQFLLGALAGWWATKNRWSSATADRWLTFAIAALLLFALAAPAGDVFSDARTPQVFVQFTLLGLVFALLCASAAQASTLSNRWLGNRPMVLLGAISYSLYLWHYPILGWLKMLTSGIWLCISYTLAALAVSALSYRFVERPFLRP